MIRDARYLTGQMDRSRDLDDNGQWERVRLRSPSVEFASCREVDEQDWGVKEAEDVGGVEEPDFQVLVATRCPRSSLRLPDMEERDAFRELYAITEGSARNTTGTATSRVSWPNRDTCHARKNPARHVCLVTPLSCTSRQKKTERGTSGMPDLQEDGRHNGKNESNNSPGRDQGRGGTEEEQPRKF